MEDHKIDPQYPDLKGSGQHHDLKNKPGEKGDAQHVSADGSWEKLTDKNADDLKDDLASDSGK